MFPSSIESDNTRCVYAIWHLTSAKGPGQAEGQMKGRPGDICSLIGFVIPRCQRTDKQRVAGGRWTKSSEMCLLTNYVVYVVVVVVVVAYKCFYYLARQLDSFICGIWRRAKNETRQDKNECCTGNGKIVSKAET